MKYYSDKFKNSLKKEYHKLLEYRKQHLNGDLKLLELDHNSKSLAYQSSQEMKPLVVMFHEWNWGFRRHNPLSDYCIRNDMNYIQPKFRDYNFGKDGFLSLNAIDDIERQIEYFIDNSKTVSSVNLVGFSGGGYMALKFKCLSSIDIKKTLALSPITDISKWYKYLKKQGVVYYHDILKYLSGDLNKLQNLNTKISPLFMNMDLSDRIILIHGQNDRIVPFDQSKLLFEKMAVRKLNLTKININIDSSISKKLNGYDKEKALEFYSHTGGHEDDSYLAFHLLQKNE